MTEGADFFQERWPGARAVSDPEHFFYAAFGVPQGGLAEMFGLGALRSGVMALSQGHRQGKSMGDVWTMPGFFLVQTKLILWRYETESAGDHPDLSQIASLAAQLALP